MFDPFIHNIDPVIGQIGGMYLWWYGSCYSLGFLGLFYWLSTLRNPAGLERRQIYDLTILIAAGVLIGGRLVEVIFYEWSYYSENLFRIFWVWLGGMSTHGILLGGTFGAWLYSRLNQKNFLSLADELVIPAAFIMGVGRIGNFIDGQIVGSVTDVWWAVKFPDVDGFRHPVVLYDGLKNLLLLPILLYLRKLRLPRGVLLGAFLFGYGFFRIFIDFFREYRVDIFGLPPGQEFNIGMSIAGVLLIVWAVNRKGIQKQPAKKPVLLGDVNESINWMMQSRRLILLCLLLIPLVIPSDWTQDIPDRYGKRHEGMIHSVLYPVINTENE